MPISVGVEDPGYQNEYYRIALQSTRHEVIVWAWTPDDFEMGLTENWNFIVGGGSPAITAAFNVASGGLAPTNQILTAQVWSGGSPLRFGLPLHFKAMQDSITEVIAPVKYLLKMALPQASGLFLRPPGPSINSKLGGSNNGDQITLWVGNYIRIPEIFIEAVSVTWKGKLDQRGFPMEADCALRCATLYAPITDNIDQWISGGIGTGVGGRPSTGGAGVI